MAEYRKHWLVNALGNVYTFTEKDNKTFLYEPKGFGFQKEYTVQTVGNSELVTSERTVLGDITGDLLFYKSGNGNQYQEYQDFIQFCKYVPLEFHYLTPNEINSYYCDIIFVQADKTEIDADDKILHIPVTFHRLSPWYTDYNNNLDLDNTPMGKGKYFDLVYDYSYAGTNLSNSVIYNNGTDDVGFVVQVDGKCENPQFTLYQNNVLYGICKLTGTYDFAMINSIDRSESLYLEKDGSVITNPEQYQDFAVRNGTAYLTWCKLKVGETIFNFTCGNIDTFDGKVIVSFKNSFISV